MSSSRRSGCPISIALDLLGDQWTLLVVRDLMFKGHRRFTEFQNAGERIATNVLAERLERLECAGIITRERDPDDGRRVVYALTQKGRDLAPVLVELVLWSDRYEKTDAPRESIHEMQRSKARLLRRLRAPGKRRTS